MVNKGEYPMCIKMGIEMKKSLHYGHRDRLTLFFDCIQWRLRIYELLEIKKLVAQNVRQANFLPRQRGLFYPELKGVRDI
jgi:hypothetical protein